MKRTAVIMAGGKGERFWPRSRTSFPKQFLSLTEDGKTMIQLTAERLLPLVDPEDIYIVTNQAYIELVKENLPYIPEKNILAEPQAKNTAPCIGLAATVIQEKYDDAIMFVMPADHLIKYDEMYLDTLRQAEQCALLDDNLLTIGITPTYPETGYGYINFGKDENSKDLLGIYTVKKFVEKPDLDTAKEYLASGQFLWNSGMFVWKASSILKNYEEHLPVIYAHLQVIGSSIGTPNEEKVLITEYDQMPGESVDYGIMEKARHIFTLPGNFGWDDVGSWLALERINRTNEEGNIFQGEVISTSTTDTTIVSNKKMIAAIGLDNMIVVDTDDALLVCEKDSAQDIKKIIAKLKEEGRTDLI